MGGGWGKGGSNAPPHPPPPPDISLTILIISPASITSRQIIGIILVSLDSGLAVYTKCFDCFDS